MTPTKLSSDGPSAERPPATADAQERAFTTGILPAQDLFKAIENREIRAADDITDDQVQPASLDLRLDRKAYRVRASFLPGPNATVEDKLRTFSMHEMDI